MNEPIQSILISLVIFIIQEAKRAKMTQDEIKAQLGIDVAEFCQSNPDLIPDV
jgi:hypothetical protein